MSNESKQNSSLRDFTISMHCITVTICLTMIDASLPEDFDRSLLHKIKKLAEDCETPASLNKLLNSSKELEKKLPAYPVSESIKESAISIIQTFEEI